MNRFQRPSRAGNDVAIRDLLVGREIFLMRLHCLAGIQRAGIGTNDGCVHQLFQPIGCRRMVHMGVGDNYVGYRLTGQSVFDVFDMLLDHRSGVDHRDLVLMDEEKDDFIMICVSRAAEGDLVVDL